MVLRSVGGRTQFTGLIASGLIVIILLWIADFFEPLPRVIFGTFVPLHRLNTRIFPGNFSIDHHRGVAQDFDPDFRPARLLEEISLRWHCVGDRFPGSHHRGRRRWFGRRIRPFC